MTDLHFITNYLVAPIVATMLIVGAAYPVALWYYRAKQIRHARRIVRIYIADAVKGDSIARNQVASASYLLNSYNL